MTIERFIEGGTATAEMPDADLEPGTEDNQVPTSTADLEAIKSEVASVAQFVRERSEPLMEEQARLRKSLEQVIANQRETQRAEISAKSMENSRRVDAGTYAGLDALDLTLARSLQRAAAHSHGDHATREWGIRLKAAMDSVTAGKGDELVPNGFSRKLWHDVRMDTRVASLFKEVEMPTNPFDIPLQLGEVAWYPGTENTATTAAGLATKKQTLTAYELLAEVPWSLTLEEDAVIAMLPELRKTLVDSASNVLDDVLLNADATAANNINRDEGTVGLTTSRQSQWRIGFDGLLHLPLVDNTNQGTNFNAEISSDMFIGLLAKLGKYAVTNDAVFICDTSSYIQALGVEQVATVDKLGPKATILNGQLGAIFGVPIVVSSQMRLADSDGKITNNGAANNKGRVLAVNTSQWRIGYRRRLMIETQRDIQKRQHTMVVSMRFAFAERTGDRTSATHTALHYNITL